MRHVWAVVFLSTDGKAKTREERRDAVALSHGGWWHTRCLLILFHVCVYNMQAKQCKEVWCARYLLFFTYLIQTFYFPKAFRNDLYDYSRKASQARTVLEYFIYMMSLRSSGDFSVVFQWSINFISEVTFKIPYRKK